MSDDAIDMTPSGGEELTGKQIHYGAMAKRDFEAGKNPPSWVGDEETWDKAKAAASKTYSMDDDAFWSVVVSIYENMGGETKARAAGADKGLEAANPEGINQYSKSAGAAREASDHASDKSREASESESKANKYSSMKNAHEAAADAHEAAARAHEEAAEKTDNKEKADFHKGRAVVHDKNAETHRGMAGHFAMYGKSAAVSTLNQISARRMAKDAALQASVKDNAYSLQDLQCEVSEELSRNALFNSGGPCCWVLDIVAPAHEEGETWEAVAQGNDGKLYCCQFKIDADHEVELVGEPREVEQTTDYEYVAAEEAEARRAAAAGLQASNPEGINQYTKGGGGSSERGKVDKSKVEPGDKVTYDDGRPGHEGVKGEVLDKDERGMHVQFEDRASPTRVGFHEKEWMDNLTHHPDTAGRAGKATEDAKAEHESADKASRAASQASPEGKAEAHRKAGEAYDRAAAAHDKADKAHMADNNGKMAMHHATERVHTHNMGILHHSAADRYGSGKPSEIAKAKEMESRAAKSRGALRAGEFRGNQHQSAGDLADEHSTAARVASRKAMKASRDIDGDSDAGMHKAAGLAHAAAKAAHEAAAEKHRSAGNQDEADEHALKATKHGEKAAEHETKAKELDAMYARAAGPAGIECRMSHLDELAASSEEGIIMYMPGGVHEITPSQSGEAVDVTVLVDAQSAEKVEQQRQALDAAGKKPFFSVQHQTEIAAFWPEQFFWDTRVDATGAAREGIWVRGTWTKSGQEAVEGKDFRSFSPTFFVDAIRTSRENPARVVCNRDARANMGALENDPAFQTISPLWARNAGATGNKQPKGDGMEVTDTPAELQAKIEKLERDAAMLSVKSDELAKAQLRAVNAEIRELQSKQKAAAGAGRIAELEAADLKRRENQADRAIDFMVTRGDIAVKDTEAQIEWKKRFVADEGMIKLICGDMSSAGNGSRQQQDDDGRTVPGSLLPGVRQAIRNMPGNSQGPGQPGVVIAGRNGTGVDLQRREQGRGDWGRGSGFSVSGALKRYFELVCRNKDVRWQDAACRADNYRQKGLAALEAAALYKTDLEPNSLSWEHIPLMEIGRMIGLEAADYSNNNLGVLSGTLVLQRTLPFFKYKYPELLNLYTDFSDTPGLLNQAENTRIVIQPAVQKYDTTLDTAGRPKGWSTVSAAKTKDVTLTLTDYVAVPIVFGNDILASTIRRLFDEQAVLAVNALAGYFVSLLTDLFTLANYNAYAVQNGTLVPVPYTSYVKDLQSFSMADLDNLDAIFTSNQVPEEDRAIMLTPLYYAKLRGDPRLEFMYMGAGGRAAESAGPWLTEARLPKLSGFAPYKAPYLPGSIPKAAPTTNNVVGFAFQKAGAVLKSRLPQDFTQALGVMIPGSVTTITDPDTKISIMLVQYINLTSGYAEWRPEVMLGVAVGDNRAGLVVTSQ